MPLTADELRDFCYFSEVMVANGKALSLSHCLQMWREDPEYAGTIAAIREGEIDSAMGRTKPLEEAIDDIRRELGLPLRQRSSQKSSRLA